MAALGVSNARKFRVLTWKTLIVKMRHYIETTLDLLVPTFLFIIMAVLRYQGGDTLTPTNEPAQMFPPDFITREFCNQWSFKNATFLYAPKTNTTDEIMEKFIQTNKYYQNKGCPKYDLLAWNDEDRDIFNLDEENLLGKNNMNETLYFEATTQISKPKMQIYKFTCGLWKSCILKKKDLYLNILQLLISVLIFIIMPLVKNSDVNDILPVAMPNHVIRPSVKATFTLSTLKHLNQPQLFYYTPINNFTKDLINKVVLTIPVLKSLYDGKFLISM